MNKHIEVVEQTKSNLVKYCQYIVYIDTDNILRFFSRYFQTEEISSVYPDIKRREKQKNIIIHSFEKYHTHARADTHTHIHTDACPYAHTYTHTRANTHIHTQKHQ